MPPGPSGRPLHLSKCFPSADTPGAQRLRVPAGVGLGGQGPRVWEKRGRLLRDRLVDNLASSRGVGHGCGVEVLPGALGSSLQEAARGWGGPRAETTEGTTWPLAPGEAACTLEPRDPRESAVPNGAGEGRQSAGTERRRGSP